MILHPFEAFLLIRGLRTLDLRVRAACDNAMELAIRLSNHAAVSAVLYPGLPHHPGHDVARRQMKGGFGGMLSIRVRGGAEAAIATAARVRLWKRATSLGGVESLIEHRASIEGDGLALPAGPAQALRRRRGRRGPLAGYRRRADRIDSDPGGRPPAPWNWRKQAFLRVLELLRDAVSSCVGRKKAGSGEGCILGLVWAAMSAAGERIGSLPRRRDFGRSGESG